MSKHWPLGVVLLAYLALGAVYALRIPAWQAPDEPAHYNVTRHIATTSTLPVIEPGDWLAGFAGPGPRDVITDVSRITYDDHQPPLFYALAVPVYLATDGALPSLRLFALLLGGIAVVCAYATAHTLSGSISVSAFTAALLALLPQRLHIMASFNNDALSEALLGGVMLAAVHMLTAKKPDVAPRHWFGLVPPGTVALALLAGLCMLTKAQAYLALPLGGLAVLWTQRHSMRALVVNALAYGALAIALPVQWWARNIAVYGWPDLLGLNRHDAVVVLSQPTTAQMLAQPGGFPALLQSLLQTTFQSFWGQFGWMSVPVRSEFYLAALAFTLLSATLFLLWWWRNRRAHSAAHVLLFILFVMTVAAFAWYNTKFFQAQGRYLYQALIPMTIAASLGWHGLAPRLLARWRWLGLMLVLVVVNVWLLVRVVLPAFGV